MNTKAVSIALFLAVSCVVGAYYAMRPDKGKVESGNNSTSETSSSNAQHGKTSSEAKPTKTNKVGARHDITRKRLEPKSVERLRAEPYVIRCVTTTSGKAENSDWGISRRGSFLLTSYVDCEIEILERKETVGGEIKVVEKRTYTRATQELDVSEADVSLSLYDTLPLEGVLDAVKGVGVLLAAYPPATEAGVAMAGGANKVDGVLRAIDGRSARDTLQKFGVKIPKSLEDKVNAFISKKFKTYIPFSPSDIEGKSYLFTYYQDAETKGYKVPPLRVNVKRADGSSDLSDKEWMVLRRANAFLDSSFRGQKEFKVGDTHEIESGDFECLFDPYLEGSYCGKIVIERKPDRDGEWYLTVQPGSVAIVADDGRSGGELRIEKGEAKFNDETSVLRAMVVSGKVAAKKMSKHHMLFNARIEGMCDFRAALTTEDKHK